MSARSIGWMGAVLLAAAGLVGMFVGTSSPGYPTLVLCGVLLLGFSAVAAAIEKLGPK